MLSRTGTMANTLGQYNPLRYRGYVYDVETGLYYLQSRYYDPEMGRFINADAFASTGQGLTGNNMFAYCLNNPVICVDVNGTAAIVLLDEDFVGHIGIMLQDEEGNWWHFYWGAEKSNYAWVSFGINSRVVTWCVEYVGELSLDAINDSGQFSGDYEKMLYIEGDFSASFGEMSNPSGQYNLYLNNCSQKSLEILSLSDTEYKFVLDKAQSIVLPKDAFQYLQKWISVKDRLDKNKSSFKTPKGNSVYGGIKAYAI